MSRIGLKPIKIEQNVQVEILTGGRYGHQKVIVKGPKGELSEDIRRGVDIALKNGEILLTAKNDIKLSKCYHGLYRTLIFNMVVGVTKGFTKVLQMVGVGYRALLKGNDIELSIGLNHPVYIKAPSGITFSVSDNTEISISGINKQLVGETAARIRALKKPEPYKGKGIMYKGEYVRRKAGKAAITNG